MDRQAAGVALHTAVREEGSDKKFTQLDIEISSLRG